jgi:catechol 2,3-dioxygenase-like lactoylglutathione lyase family enzyme
MITAMPRIAIAVRDMDRAIATFRDGLGMPVHEFKWLREALGIRMSLCVPTGGSHIELMSPDDPARAHSRSLIRFLDRRGIFARAVCPDPTPKDALARADLVMPLMQDAGDRHPPKNTTGCIAYTSGSAEDLEREIEQGLTGLGRESRARLTESPRDVAVGTPTR